VFGPTGLQWCFLHPCALYHGGGLREFFFPYEEQQLGMVLADARVTAISENRRNYTFYLDGSETERYNFNSYVSANPALRQAVDETLGLDPSDLAHYMRRNDRLTKAANSPLLTVRRYPDALDPVLGHAQRQAAAPERIYHPNWRYGAVT
jgi:hypothetical protein